MAKDELDIDLPLVISKKIQLLSIIGMILPTLFLYLIMNDMTRHFRKKTLEMQHFFKDSTDMEKLYLNYPLIESYLHLKSIPDEEYIHRKIPVSIQSENKYIVKSERVIEKAVGLPHKINNLLAGDRYQIRNLTYCWRRKERKDFKILTV